MEENVTISHADKEQENVITNQKSVNLIDIEGDNTQDNINNISNIVKNSQSIIDNSSANIIDILQGVSLMDEGPKIINAVIPRQVIHYINNRLYYKKPNPAMLIKETV